MASFNLTAIHLEDPDHSNLRKAARLALVMPSMVVLGKVVLDSAEFSTFAAFGAFGLLGLANFGGPRRVRFGLGVGFTLLGGALVGVGTLLSDNPWLSVALVAVVAFSATFVEVLGGYATAGTSVLILAAVLSVMVPAAPGSMGARVTGWLFAGLVSSLALAMLWPRRRRPRVRLELASTARTLAGFMRGADRLEAGPLDDCFTCVLDLRRDVDAAVAGPGGPRSRDQALCTCSTSRAVPLCSCRSCTSSSATGDLSCCLRTPWCWPAPRLFSRRQRNCSRAATSNRRWII